MLDLDPSAESIGLHASGSILKASLTSVATVGDFTQLNRRVYANAILACDGSTFIVKLQCLGLCPFVVSQIGSLTATSSCRRHDV